ncbi:MAG: tetratricopeptide repeat protein [Tatlockia sp.]|nr:tetratricopeptide repeat protein [Tatlockia sp.]
MSYMTEEEQLAAIKKWWFKHSNLLTIILSIILLCVAGYKYWSWHIEKVNSQASTAYEQLMLAFSNKDEKSIQSYANQLIKNYSKTVYADAARLTLAKLQVTEEGYDEAQENLNVVATHSKLPALKQLARLRIARLLSAKKDYKQALEKLTVVEDKAYMPVVNELKGDIFVATGQYQQAILSYKEAITEVRTSGMGNLFLEMKTNELAALHQSSNTDAATQNT